ncbi:MAG: S8 family serine peptidase [Elusimicrobia bacterium]|nr:S8 family serine peptidase [Elusimicrobiota bacterium]
MNDILRRATAAGLSSILILLAPGVPAWAQTARISVAPAAGSVTGAMGAAGAVSPVRLQAPALSVPSTLSVPVLSLPSAAPRLSVPASAAAAAVRAEAGASAVAAGSAAQLRSPAVAASALVPASPAAAQAALSASAAQRAPPASSRAALASVAAAVTRIRPGARAALPAALNAFFDGGVRRGAESLAVNGVKETSKRSSGLNKATPDETPARSDEGPDSTRGLDELGNPQRRVSPGGPDDRSDPDGSDRGGNSELLSMMSPSWLGEAGSFLNTWTGASLVLGTALGLGVLTSAISPAFLITAPLYALFVIPSLILHEMGHAKAAEALGDPTARIANRLGWSPRDLLTHISPFMTVVVPLLTLAFTGMLFGGAVPVPVEQRNLDNPDADMAKIALAGPAVNFALALGGAAVAAGLAAVGAAPTLVWAAASFVLFNSMLGLFNLLPFAPLDGHHILRHILSDWLRMPAAAQWLDARAGSQLFALVLALMYGGAYIGAMVNGFAGLLLLPAGMLAGSLLADTVGGPRAEPPAAVATMPDSRVLLVRLEGGARPLSSDIHLGLIDVTKRGGMKLFSAAQSALSTELEAAGLGREALLGYGASPVAAYRRINTATIRVPESAIERFKIDMAARGFEVFENASRSIVRPVEDDPAFAGRQAEPSAGAISMKDTLKLSTADKIHELARARWGDPGVGWRASLARTLRGLFGAAPAQPKVAVIDTGVDIEHPLVKPGLAGHKDVRPDGDGIDDNGHGTWVTSMVLNYAPWLKSITHYKAFTNGGATLDDVLKALTMAANDGNLIMSNSWGDDGGDPDSPDARLVKKLGEEGHVMVFAAGNNGYAGANTVGSPAIAAGERVIATAATDKNKRVVGFSSKGPGSPVTKKGGKWKDYPRKPDAAEQGNDTEGAWPGGKTRAISGTSMSTPKLAGTIALLAMMFGVTEKGEKLDRVVKAVMSTLTNELKQSEAAIGSGFSAAKAAYDKLAAEGMTPFAPAQAGRELGMAEFGVLNAVGVVASIAGGIWLNAVVLGILGTFVLPIPLIFAYVGLRRLMGDAVRWPGLKFSPSLPWGGRRSGPRS